MKKKFNEKDMIEFEKWVEEEYGDTPYIPLSALREGWCEKAKIDREKMITAFKKNQRLLQTIRLQDKLINFLEREIESLKNPKKK